MTKLDEIWIFKLNFGCGRRLANLQWKLIELTFLSLPSVFSLLQTIFSGMKNRPFAQIWPLWTSTDHASNSATTEFEKNENLSVLELGPSIFEIASLSCWKQLIQRKILIFQSMDIRSRPGIRAGQIFLTGRLSGMVWTVVSTYQRWIRNRRVVFLEMFYCSMIICKLGRGTKSKFAEIGFKILRPKKS